MFCFHPWGERCGHVVPSTRHGVSGLAVVTGAMHSVQIASVFSVQTFRRKYWLFLHCSQRTDISSLVKPCKTGALKERAEVHFYNDTPSAAKLELNGVRASLCWVLDFTHQPESISFMQLTARFKLQKCVWKRYLTEKSLRSFTQRCPRIEKI